MGGPRTIQEVREKIMEAYFRLHENGEEPFAKQVRFEAINLCDAVGISVKPFPTLRTVQDIIRNFKASNKKKTDKDKLLDTPWSMATLKDFPLPNDSIPNLLKVWKASVALSRPLTIRDAIWTSRLGTFINDTRLLLFWSKLYSLKHRVADSLGQDFDSRLLDSCLVTDDSWDIPIALMTTGVSQSHTLIGYPRPRTLKIGVHNADSLAAYVERFYSVKNPISITEQESKTITAIYELPSLTTLGLTEGSIWVYIYWLKEIYLGPKWESLTTDQAIALINQLREWVKNHPNNQIEYMNERDSSDRGMNIISELQVDPMPWHILREVGYKTKSIEEEQNERTHR